MIATTSHRRFTVTLTIVTLCLILCMAGTVSAQTDDSLADGSAEAIDQPLALSIVANPPIALAGDDVTFTITAQNTSDTPFINFTIVDILPDQFRITATNPGATGDIIVSRQQVTWRGGTLNPGESVTITIDASILMSASLLVNRFCAGAENLAGICAQTNVLGVTALPQTGETPWWRVMFGVGIIMTIIGLFGIIVMVLFPAKSARPDSYRYLRH
ncbi:MAG: hypothetical protein RLP44_20645 [Aggregatilineales bacterium]